MKLIGSLTSPYVRKVRIVMAEKRLDYHLEIEDVWASDRILESNPLGKVPCLVMEGGEAVFDSRVIVEYVDTLSPVGKLIPDRGRERAEVRTWEALGDGMLDAAILARLEQHLGRRRDGERSQRVDRAPDEEDPRVARRDEQGPGRQAVLQRHPLLAVRHRGRLRARLPRLPLSRRSTGAAAREPGAPDEKLAQRQSFIDTAPPVA
jgi:glutathione S-transferase